MVEIDNVWVMNRVVLRSRGNPTCSIIDYRVYCTIRRRGEIYMLEHTRARARGRVRWVVDMPPASRNSLDASFQLNFRFRAAKRRLEAISCLD